MSNQGIKIFAPGCISLLSYGMKYISIAVEKPGNEIIAHLNNSGKVTIDSFSKEKEDINNHKSIILNIANDFLKKTGSDHGVSINILNKIPFSAGLGELEANITGTVSAINDLLKSHIEKHDLFNFLIDKSKEYNLSILPSHVAANLYGGIILYNKNAEKSIQKLYAPHGINLTLINITNNIDKSVFNSISGEELFVQSSNIASFIKGLFATDLDLISDSLKNNVFEEKIAKNIDWYNDIRDISYSNEAYAIGFSHYGETVFILNPNTHIRENNIQDIEKYFNKNKIQYKLINTVINLNGMFKF